MATNINQELFKRYAPKKKLEIINHLTTAELLATTPETLMRIVKEAGTKAGTARSKVLRISSDRRSGNDWNSTVESVEIHRGKLMLDIYDKWILQTRTILNHILILVRMLIILGRYLPQTITVILYRIISLTIDRIRRKLLKVSYLSMYTPNMLISYDET